VGNEPAAVTIHAPTRMIQRAPPRSLTPQAKGTYAHSSTMPREDGVPPGTLTLLILRLLDTGPLHGYAIAQRIHLLSQEELSVEEGSLYPALQKLLVNGWVKASWTTSESGREVRAYRLTAAGRRQMESALAEYRRVGRAVGLVLDKA